MNLSGLREDIVTGLSTITLAGGIELSVLTYRNEPVDALPVAVVSSFPLAVSADFGDVSSDVNITINVVVSKAETPESWAQLDELVSGNLIVDALRGICEVENFTNIGDDIEINDTVGLGFVVNATATL